MPRLVQFKLTDGRSLIAGYDDSSECYAGQDATLVFVADDRSELLPFSAVRACSTYDGREPLGPSTRIYDFALPR